MIKELQLINPNFFDALNAYIRAEVKAVLQGSMNQLQEYRDEFLTIQQAADYIKVSKPTLWDWSKKGILNKHYIAGQPRYKKSEIDAAFLKLDEKGGVR